MKTKVLIFLILNSTFILDARAGSATWNLNPTSGDWNTPGNWTPNTVPNGPADVATFADSGQETVSLSTSVVVDSVTFSADASAYVINAFPVMTLEVSGSGIVNNSGVTQTFIANATSESDSGGITFSNSAVVGSNVAINVLGGHPDGSGGQVFFEDSSSAGQATFDVVGSVPDAYPSIVWFDDSSTAGNATIILHQDGQLFVNGPTGQHPTLANANVTSTGGITHIIDGATAGHATIDNVSVSPNWYANLEIGSDSTAGNATITNQGATATSSNGSTLFIGPASGGNAIITCNGGDGQGKRGGSVSFGFINATDTGTADHATLIANGGTDGGSGGRIVFTENAVGGVARCELFGNGTLDISQRYPGIGIGSLEGDGMVSLGARNLSVGANDLETEFSGVIEDGGLGGSLKKVGTNRFTLSGANTYKGGTIVNAGILAVANTGGSGTGAGGVEVKGGSLGGSGTIAGVVKIGTGAFLAPATYTNNEATLTIQSALFFNNDATYVCTFKARKNKERSDLVIANGVTINGATINLQAQTRGRLRPGLTLTLISNTSANPIEGNFSNLADGSTVTIGQNTFQADYEGGDGNNLTLTVVAAAP